MSFSRFLSRAARDRARRDEFDAHLDLHVDELVARGRTPEEARREARLAFGNPRAKREEIDQMNRLPLFDVLRRDLRYAVRVLLKSPAFTITAVATLALVIGANTAVFSLADAILVRPLPYPHPENLATVKSVLTGPKGTQENDSHDGTTWETLRDGATALDVAVIAGGFGNDVNLVVNGSASMVSQARVGAGYFHVLGIEPAIGREFTRDEDRPGGAAVAVLSYGLWQRVFHGDRSAVGQGILLRGERYDVVGIMPQGFENPGDSADVWTPVRPSRTGEGGGTNFGVYARVKEGHTWTEALSSMPPVDDGFVKRMGVAPDKLDEWSGHFTMTPLQDMLVSGTREPILMLAGAVVTVLLVACVNLAVLLLARGGTRTKEIATRMALGSGRGAVVRQLMVESAVLAIVGGGFGLLVGYLGLEALKTLGGDTFGEWRHVTLDSRVLAATAGLSLLTSVLFGLVPAFQSSRLDVQAALSEGGSRSIAGGSGLWTRRILVTAEVALGVVLLVVTALLIRGFLNLRNIDPGFDGSRLVTASVSLQDARYKTASKMNQLFDESLRLLNQTPGIEAAAVSLELPYRRLLNMGFRFMDLPQEDKHATSIANVMYVTPSFFDTLKIPLRGGRNITDTDVASAPSVVVVNEAFLRLLTEGRDPIGRVIGVANARRQIVGVVGDVKATRSFMIDGMLNGPITTGPQIYLPAAQTPDGFMGMHIWFSPMWSVRATSLAVADAAIQRAISTADPLLPVGRIRRMADVQASATSRQRLLMILVGVLGVAAVLLAAIGIHGLIAHQVQQRTREFGIRLALGATAGDTIRSVAMAGIVLSAIGAVIGAGLSVMAVQLAQSLVGESYLWHVSASDPRTYVAVAAFLLLVSTAASLIPALRILRLDPATTLRQ